ncbi:hypothetical protein BST50_04390 [Vibrio vulnificus]|uniref:PTS sugar transporter subunit IIB n=1 Tax=Vibrio vulnificus TaxID=672 RepID=UPI000BA8A7CA|nr:PTS sugar transporter subunit IIB [Vibrio vulnificus]PAO30003.1 hypothetical protein BST49_20795 [Vibrio vulnificus]PAO42421.1 hypothetical protein BST50_04390 [Vibrio vulnificus]PAO47210.1 hypothetical protein BST53_06820 [Vibrio vulnificus]PAO50870.1 hypothetical protein BST54_05260 [Vibrio vulnificus]PAO59138.1 hypothetical protein BST57_08115 [Vibrio vulnificus]
MKKLFICCGTGVATSTQAREKTEQYLKEHGLFDAVEVRQGSISEIPSIVDWANLIISTAGGDGKGVKLINALPLVTGFGADKVLEEIKAQVEA